MVLGLGVSAKKTNTSLQVFIGDREAHDTAIKMAHFHQIVAKESHMAQPGNLRHSVLPCRRSVHDEERFLTLSRGFHVSTLASG
jgi:hypothetical protein